MQLRRFVTLALAALCAAALALTPAATSRALQTQIFVSPTGSDANPCTRALPCASFDRAYRVAQAGHVVEVAAGTYPDQQLNLDPSKTSAADVVFEPAPGAAVSIPKLALGDGLGTPAASHVTVKRLRVDVIQAFTPARDLTWQSIDAKNFYVRGVQGLLVKGGDYGPCTSTLEACGNSKIDLASPPEQPNANITIDGAVFHDYRIGDPDDHFECLFIFSGTNITVRNSRFSDCEFFDIFVQYAGAEISGLTIERNRFDTPWNGRGVKDRPSAIAFSPRGRPFANVLVRANSFRGTTGVSWNDDGDSTAYSGVRAVRNIFGSPANCYAFVSYSENLWGGGTCGAADGRTPFGYELAAGALRPDGSRARAVRRVFADAARGRGAAAIARALGRSRAPAPPGRRWNAALVRTIVRDRVYLGGVYGAAGDHPALVARRTWQAAQRFGG